MKRNYSLDLMRIFLCLCVITLHAYDHFDIYGNISIWISTFLVQTDGAFYMLSGYFNLEKDFNNSNDIKEYYKNKIINVLIPFLAYLVFWGAWDYLHTNSEFKILDFLSYLYELFMDTASNGHLWFLYPLFGLLLSTPFLSKMLHNMDEKELRILWYIALGWNIVQCYLCANVDISFKWACWLLDGWPLLYVSGYYYRHVIANEKNSKWLIIGIICFVLTCVGKLYIGFLTGSVDILVTYIIFCVTCLMFWDKAIIIKNDKVKKVIKFLSSYTFLIYLFHMRGLEYVVRKLPFINGGVGVGLIIVITTFVVTLLVSIVVKLLLKPIQNLINKIWVIE